MNRILPSATVGGNGLRVEPWLSSQDERDSLPRSPGLHGCTGTSERGVWGAWRNAPQDKE
jgi:hypothetical protein